MTVNDLVLQITKMTAAEQFDLAFKVAENIGYDLTPAKCEYCGSGPCENCMNSGYADPEKAVCACYGEHESYHAYDVIQDRRA